MSMQRPILSNLLKQSIKITHFEQLTEKLNKNLQDKEQKLLSKLLHKNFSFIEQSSRIKKQRDLQKRNEAIAKTFGKVVPPTASSLFLNLPIDFIQPVNAKSCVVSVVGLPNAGKSTIMNHLMGQKISAVSSKQQTTRSQIMAIKTIKNSQIIFIDTPGIPSAYQLKVLPEGIAESVWESCGKCDLVMYVIDASKRSFYKDIQQLKEITRRYSDISIVLIFNKTDISGKERLLRVKEQFIENFASRIKNTFFTVGMKFSTLEPVIDCLLENSVLRPWEYPPVNEGLLSKTERALEIIRDKIFKRFNEEVPYSVNLSIESWNENDSEIAIICYLLVPRISHKVIIIGKDGECLQFIREKSIQEMESLFLKRIKLLLMLKVTEKTTI